MSGGQLSGDQLSGDQLSGDQLSGYQLSGGKLSRYLENQLLCVTKTQEAVGKLLQDILQRQLLWLACRHYILELLVKVAYQQVFGDSKSSDVKLFSILEDPSFIKVDEQVHLLLEAIPPLSSVVAISTDLAAEAEGGDHGILHCFSLPGVLVLLTFSPWGCRQQSKAFQEAAEIQQDQQEDLICNLYCSVQAYMVPDRGAYPLLHLQKELPYRGAHTTQEDRIL